MGELPRQWLAWLARLLPQQKVWGNDAVQVGRLQGGLHMDRSTHSSSAVHVTQVTHQHFYAAPGAPTDSARLSPEQRAVFALMKRLPPRDYRKVLAFMRREFETALVHQLGARQLYRLRRYVETMQRSEERERA